MHHSSPNSVFKSAASNNSRPLRAWIKLSSFQENLQRISDYVGMSRVLVVIKADAYGHGLVEIAQAAGKQAEFAVALPEELKQLRTAGLHNTVWVLEGPFSSACLHLSENVVWVIHSLWQLPLIQQALEESSIKMLSVAVKLDSGMHRLGFAEAELETVFTFLAQHSNIHLVCAMSHFAMSDEQNSPEVLEQISRFDEMLVANGARHVKASLANSGAILFYPETHRDWVRPGIMLYGGKPAPETVCPLKLNAVMHFQSAIIALHTVKKGESVGYGSTWTAQQDSRIATVAVGYADGYPRHAVNGTPVAHINPETSKITRVPLVGRVSMDMITIDVSAIEQAEIGDPIELWGEHVSADEVAKYAGTISYDLFTGVSKRVPREYIF